MSELIEWMKWTPQTFVVFIIIMSSLFILTVWDIRSPSVPRKGFFPIPLTRGDRFFLSIVTLVGTFIIFLAFLPQLDPVFALPVAGILILILIFFG